MNLRRRKPQPETPRPAVDAGVRLAVSLDYATSRLTEAVQAYATEPDSIPPRLRADYAAAIAFDALITRLAGLQADLAPRPADDPGFFAEFQYDVLRALILGAGLPALFAERMRAAGLRNQDEDQALTEAVAQAHRWVDEAAALAMVGE